MASVFESVTLTWNGVDYEVPPDRVMGLIEVVEDCITFEDLAGKVKRAKLAKAYTSAIRYAAACNGKSVKVSEESVYEALFGPEAASQITNIVHALMMMMIPPEHLRGKAEAPAPKKTPARGRATASSRKRT